MWLIRAVILSYAFLSLLTLFYPTWDYDLGDDYWAAPILVFVISLVLTYHPDIKE